MKELGLEIIRAPEDLRLGGLLSESRTLDRQSQLRGGDREHAFVGRFERCGSRSGQHRKATHPRARRDDRHQASPAAGAGRRRSDEPDGAGGARRVHQPELTAGRAQAGASRLVASGDRGVGQDVRIRLDRHRVKVERRPEMLGDRDERALQVRLCHEEGRLVEDLGVVFAVLGLLRARSLACRERSGDDRGDEEERQREELLRVGHDQLVGRRHEEPVEGDKGEDARDDRGGPTEGHRDDKHRHEIEHRDVRDLSAPDDEVDERGGDRHGRCRAGIRDQTTHQPTIVP